MQAIVLYEHGGPDQLVAADLPPPEPGPGEVVVRVEAVALNHLDLWVRQGYPGLKLEYPHLLGADIAAELEDGTKIVVSPGRSCGRCTYCLHGQDNLCRRYAIFGEHTRGGYAQLMAIPEANIVPRPARLSAVEAAAFPLTMLTAWQMLARKACVKPGETVLVFGAGAGVAVAGIQIAKLFGARVIATSTSDDKLARARELGADEVLNTTRDDVVEAVKRLTGKRGVDVVFEHIGQAVWEKAILCCAKNGRIVTCGNTSGWKASTDLRHVFFRQLQILGSTMGTKGDMLDVTDHVAAGRLKPIVHSVLPLSRAADAHRLLESQAQFGKIVLEVPRG